ncbi:MazF family transcriptional regulator [Geoalkalibacter subterraneus]|uniref:mRNA interferase n=2 Tax=Geoalkalibacter subterraneus TaxID=483547 RepID=A0A0B5FIH8_9BACT|nr:MazF family transcriptional regulator [Geoalkalibacter subterraneus]
MVEIMRRGEIWVANLNPGRGREISKIRPVLIIQDDAFTESGTPMVIILPLSTQVYPSFKRWRISIAPRERLLKACQVIVDQPRALDRTRLGEGPLTMLTTDEIAAVEKSLKAVLGLL